MGQTNTYWHFGRNVGATITATINVPKCTLLNTTFRFIQSASKLFWLHLSNCSTVQFYFAWIQTCRHLPFNTQCHQYTTRVAGKLNLNTTAISATVAHRSLTFRNRDNLVVYFIMNLSPTVRSSRGFIMPWPGFATISKESPPSGRYTV